VTETTLLASLKQKFSQHDTTNFDVFDYLHAFGSPLEAMLYARLFWPDFSELDGMVFLAETIADEADRRRVRAAVKQGDGDLEAVEQSFNLVEVGALFGARAGETTVEQDRRLAATLQRTWSCRLQESFPGRDFEVQVVDADGDGVSPAVLFHELRGSGKR
jgi:hypothetical protein